MAPLLFRDLKNLSCSSPAAAAVRPSLERRLSCSSASSTATCPPNSERQPMVVRSRKAVVTAGALAQLPTEPRTHRHDGGKKGQQQLKVVANGGLVSPANSSRYLLGGRAADEIQEVEPAPPAADATANEEAADARSTPAQDQVSESLLKHCWTLDWLVLREEEKIRQVKRNRGGGD
jgi:hypothetical protein